MKDWNVVATGDGSKTLRHPEFDELLHSDSGARAEALHVFLKTSRVAERLRSGAATRVFEVGFGTGLNFLLTADCALRYEAHLEYDAVDVTWPDADVLRALNHGEFVQDAALWAAFLGFADRLVSSHASSHSGRVGTVTWTVHKHDARAFDFRAARYDAIYQDPFSPATHPALWDAPFLAKLAAALEDGGTLSTYSCRGAVRRALEACGLVCERVPGTGRKREILRATQPCART